MWSYYRELVQQLDKEFLDYCKANTNERVVPAPSERPHVEQQAEEEHVQLPKEVSKQP